MTPHKLYYLDGLEVGLVELFDSVRERMVKASYYANVQILDGEPFRLHPAAMILTMKPNTYNYLLMTFHEFRLSPNNETAGLFVSLALLCLKKNLGLEEKQLESMDDMIENFASTVFVFVDNNKE